MSIYGNYKSAFDFAPKLELKHVSGYLPYGLKIKTNNQIREMVSGTELIDINNETTAISNVISGIGHKPLLRPISDLTKEIEHNGEKFVPIIKIVKIVANIHNDDMDDSFQVFDTGRILVKTPWDLKVELFYKTKSIGFAIYDTWNQKEKRTIGQSEVFDLLYEWHFDWKYDLIGKSLAIDKKTLL